MLGESLAEHREQVRAKVFDAMRTLLYTRGFDDTGSSWAAARITAGWPEASGVMPSFVD